MKKNLGGISTFCSVWFSAVPISKVTGPFTYQCPRSFFVNAWQGTAFVEGGYPLGLAAATGRFSGLVGTGLVSSDGGSEYDLVAQPCCSA